MNRRELAKLAAAFAAATAALGARAQNTPSPGNGVPGPTGRQAVGVNLCGMDSARPGLRYGSSTVPNINFTVPRRSEVAWLAASGYTKSRLPIQWELLQPMLHDTQANAQARAAIGEPGAFHAGHEAYITGVLDAHAYAGIRCILDLHNYCRYQDFVYQSDGSVIGLVVPADPLIRPYTSDNTQVQGRIFALAPGVTLRQSHYNDFWTRAARKWKDHPGFGGYGLMNEPYNMPNPGETVESDGSYQDLTIWPAYAQAVISAIRAVDPSNPIYLGGNGWSGAMSIQHNPGWPLAGHNIIYEVHMYLDAGTSGHYFDYDTEVAKPYNVGLTPPIDLDTGVGRLKIAVDWARQHGVRLALTETGMPIDDPRWQEMFLRLVSYAHQSDCEFYTWNGGGHWTYRNAGINHTPGWHQGRTLAPVVMGVVKAGYGIAGGALFDDGPGWAPAGAPATVTVYARGNLAAPVTLTVRSNNGGRLSKTQLTIPAGANGQDTYTFTPGGNRVSTLSYASASPSVAPPPARKVYSLRDPVAYAATSLGDAAMAILARYSACKWDLADGYTDFLGGWPASAGETVRAIADSGYGSSAGNAMEMLNWTNKDGAMGSMSLPVMRVTNGKKNSDHSVYNTWGFWCRKSIPVPGVQANPKNRVPYRTGEPHFCIVALSVAGSTNSGIVFQASHSGDSHCSEINLSNSQPQARWKDAAGKTVLLSSPGRLTPGAPAVVSFTSAPGAQSLRVNRAVVASAAESFHPSDYDQLLLGWGHQSYYPRDGFMGNLYAAITGKGAPSAAEMDVLERYLGAVAGM
ncbi:MAG: glycoside hydrolase family 5 protein [Pseudomonadota bacterium]|nr:glycoside hydrolase family 5 protein [Pseudomonadota bacterium]